MRDVDALLSAIDSVISELLERASEFQSVEWYAVNYLRTFKQSVAESTAAYDIAVARWSLSRFVIDSVEWGSPLARALRELDDQAQHVERERRRS